MVYALEKVNHLLKSGGFLIDIHPTSEPASIYFISPDSEIYLGQLEESDDYIEYLQADQAQDITVQRGTFQIERKDRFLFRIYSDEVMEMVKYLAEEWKDAIISQNIQNQASTMIKKAKGTGKFMIQEWISITRMRSNPANRFLGD